MNEHKTNEYSNTATVDLVATARVWQVPIATAELRIASNIMTQSDCTCASEDVVFGFVAEGSIEDEEQLELVFDRAA